MDREAFLLANRLVGNPDAAAGLECTLIGPRVEFTDERLVAITGADMAPTVNGAPVPAWQGLRVHAGDVLKLGPARSGVRAYLAIAGGIQTPPVLGSRATYVRGRLGGLEGRALRKADRLPLGPLAGGAAASPAPRPRARSTGASPSSPWCWARRPIASRRPGIAALFEGPYEMLPQNDRMGARLKGAFIEHTRGHDIISDGVALGGIQVIGEGQPIVLLADRQSAGGYTKIGTICSFHIGRIAQVKPGGRLQFRRVTVAEAHAMLRQSLRALDSAIE